MPAKPAISLVGLFFTCFNLLSPDAPCLWGVMVRLLQYSHITNRKRPGAARLFASNECESPHAAVSLPPTFEKRSNRAAPSSKGCQILSLNPGTDLPKRAVAASATLSGSHVSFPCDTIGVTAKTDNRHVVTGKRPRLMPCDARRIARPGKLLCAPRITRVPAIQPCSTKPP